VAVLNLHSSTITHLAALQGPPDKILLVGSLSTVVLLLSTHCTLSSEPRSKEPTEPSGGQRGEGALVPFSSTRWSLGHGVHNWLVVNGQLRLGCFGGTNPR
jgi:hypothetical protein